MDEYIERKEAEKRLSQRAEIANSAYIDQTPYQIMMLAQNVVHLIPAADVEPVRHGKWAEIDPQSHRPFWECSECKRRFHDVMWNYCPHCGAKMDAGKKEPTVTEAENPFFESFKTGLEQAINGDVREQTITEAEEVKE